MNYRRWLRISIFTVSIIYCVITFYNYCNNYHIKSAYDVKIHSSEMNLKMKHNLLKALRYTRSQAVREEIMGALSILSNRVAIEEDELKFHRITQTLSNNELLDVCLDTYLGPIDHPLYNKGQMEIKCQKKPFENVLTFVIMVSDCLAVRNILKGIKKNYNKLKVIFNIPKGLLCEIKDINISIENVYNNASDILRLLSKVDTDYVLFAQNIYHFDNQSRIERLVQMVSYTGVDIAAGGVRLQNGQFQSGCYQMAMKMYTLKLVHGYDMSFNSCLYCDYSPAPFVSRTKFLVDQFSKLKESTTVNGLSILQLFTNMMITNQKQIFVCPDVLFHVKPYDLILYNRREWFPFVSWFSLNRLILADGTKLEFRCDESNVKCDKVKGLMVPLCCLKELSDSLKFMNRLLKDQNVTFEVLEGTVMGGLKFNNILFWELDADTNFRVQSIDRMEAKLDVIKKQGYTMTLSYECPYKRDHEKCRHAGWHGSIYYAYRTPNWRTEMYGVTYILSDFRGELEQPTKINIDGEWYITYTNPVLYARNIYGGDVFHHLEHAYHLGIQNINYDKVIRDKFTECPRPGFHGCLSNFASDGSLQFQDIYI